MCCLIGERGREVRDFIEESRGAGLAKAVVVVATSTLHRCAPQERLRTTAIAEWFRDQGKRVLFMMDSSTRFAQAQKEIGLAIRSLRAPRLSTKCIFQIPTDGANRQQ